MLGPRNIGAATPPSSAKRLISQYERLSTPPACLSVSALPSTKRVQYVHDLPMPAFSAAAVNKKEKSPIRQSLRNLLSVFKKGAGGLNKKKGEDDSSELSDPLTPIGTLQKRRRSTVHGTSTIPKKADTILSPPAPTTGSLLYLSRILPPGQLDICANPGPLSTDELAWTVCNVTLDPAARKLHLSSFTSELQFVVHDINLFGCADIRSLSVSQLSEKEAKLLDEASVRSEGEIGRLKAFEMCFLDGRPKERFAAKSVKERAGWISAIWDAILPDGGERITKVAQTKTSPSATQFKSIESPIPIPLPRMSNLLSSQSQRSLPPIPPEKIESNIPASEATPTHVKKGSKKPANLHLDIPAALSPSIYPLTSRASSIPEPRPPFLSNSSGPSSTTVIRPTPLTASTYPSVASRPPSMLGVVASPPASPSVINLSQLSVVRQRLAQIERNHSQLSSRSGYSEAVVRPSTPITPTTRNSKMRKLKSGPLEPESSKSKLADTATSIESRSLARSADEKRSTTPPLDCKKSPRDVETFKQLDKEEEPCITKEDVENLLKRIAEVKGVLGGDPGYPTIHQVVLGLEDRTQDGKRALKSIQERIDELRSGLKDLQSSTDGLSSTLHRQKTLHNVAKTGDDTQEPVLRAIEDVRAKLVSDIPSLADRVQALQSGQDRLLEKMEEKERLVETKDVPPPVPRTEHDLKPVLEKLDRLGVQFQACEKAREETGVSNNEGPQILETVEKVLSMLQQESGKQVLFSQQQTESVRYLNELNNWLETFVNNGTSQIQGLSMNIEQLCRALGTGARLPGVSGPGGGGSSSNGFEGSTPNLLRDIRQLVTGMQARDQNFVALQAAVHSLLEVLSSSQVQMGAESQAIAGLITRQRQEQEALLRTFTSEISGEIKGERLRFVEAMKEATAINVQLHVEHFKQDLSREVMAMTEEVGRLHREKQIIENQISDLFAFYSKHKQSTPTNYGDTHVEAVHTAQGQQQRSRPNIPRSHHRPLPYPGVN